MIEVHTSPLTGTIYAGKPTKNGTWGKTKYDVTDMAETAVALSLIKRDKKIRFEYDGVTYDLKVTRVSE